MINKFKNRKVLYTQPLCYLPQPNHTSVMKHSHELEKLRRAFYQFNANNSVNN